MSNLDKARKWAKDYIAGGHLSGIDGPWAAAEIIQSLPDHWIDAEQLKVIIEDMCDSLEVEATTDFSKGFDNATTTWLDPLKNLLAPKLPTLADMTEEEQKACQWMQCKVKGHQSENYVIAKTDLFRSEILLPSGSQVVWSNSLITPLTDSPKMKWPGKELPIKEDPLPSEIWVDDGSSPLDVMKSLAEKWEEVDRLKPEEVPHNEPWLIEVNGWKAVGTRYARYTKKPWSIVSLNGLFSDDCVDSEITLIHKLVPENHALPEGMRLADHEEFDRVVTSPRPDLNGYYAIFRLDDGLRSGSSSEYVHSIELDFLDGEDNE